MNVSLPLLGLGALLAASSAAAGTPAKSKPNPLAKRGEYLVNMAGCSDCHTPWIMGPKGPEPDWTRLLSGHPADMKMPPAPSAPMPWMGSFAATMTAWAGPWGVSYTANLTPDPETGLGKWTEQMFIDTIRTGRHQGKGRPILPPMPWPAIRNASDADLKAIFAYLRSIKPIVNKVPEPLEPPPAPAH